MRYPHPNAAKIARIFAPLTLLGVLVAAALGMNAADLRGEQAPFKLSVRPKRRAIFPGTAARYRITIVRRHGFEARVAVWVGGLPPHTWARIVRPNRVLARLTVFTKRDVRAGYYRLRVHGSGGHASVRILLTLTIHRPRAARFTLAGNARSLLEPGVVAPVKLAVRNPNWRAIVVWNLAMRVHSIRAPRASATHPCTGADFAVKQYAGPYPLFVPPRTTRTLKDLGVARGRWPRIAMLNRPLNQDGCQGATITLSYSGSAVVR